MYSFLKGCPTENPLAINRRGIIWKIKIANIKKKLVEIKITI